MKKLLFFITLMFSPMLASAQTVSDVQNSGCMANARGVESEESVPTIILKKEGTILSVELQNYISNCATYDFEIKSSISDGIDGSPCSLSVNVNSVLPKIITTCDCPFNVSFTIRDFEPNSFYLDCWWYKGLVELTEGEPLVLEDVYEDATIDGMNFTLQKAFHQAMVTRSEWVGEVRIPSELSHEGQTYSVTSISSDAFTDNTTMTKVFIPRTIKNMNFSEESGFNRNLFSWCSALESIEVEEGNPVLCSVGGVLFNKEKTRLYTYPAADSRTSYTVPEGVTWIYGSAFASNHHLVSISLPDGVTSLGSSAFYDCTNLEEVNLPYGLKSLAGYLFWNCSSLTDIQIPKSVTSVMSNAFKGCKALKTLDLPESVTFLGDYVFSGCKLDSLIIRGVIDFSWNGHYWLFDGMGTETKVYVHPTQVDKFKAIYKGPVYPLPEQKVDYIPFVEFGKQWHVVSAKNPNYVCRQETYWMFENVERAGKIYAHTICNDDVLDVTEETGLFREENRRVYKYDETEGRDIMLYDFSLKEGDTFAYEFGFDQPINCKVLKQGWLNDGPQIVYSCTLTPADTLDIKYRRLRTWTIGRDNGLGEFVEVATWVEGIGALENMFNSFAFGGVKSCLAYVERKDNETVYHVNEYLPFSFCNGYDVMGHVHGCDLPTGAEDYGENDGHHQLTYELKGNSLHVYGEVFTQCGPNNYAYFYVKKTDDPLVNKIEFEIQEVEPVADCVALHATDFYVPGFDPNMNYIVVDNRGEEHPVINKTPEMAYRPMIEDGKVWTMVYMGAVPPEYQHTFSYKQIKLGSEIEVDGMTFKQIVSLNWDYDQNRPDNWTETDEYLGETDGKVYLYNQHFKNIVQIMDFTLQVGDTYRQMQMGDSNGYMDFVVTAVTDTVIATSIDRTPRKCLYLSRPSSTKIDDVWIEGIGSLVGGVYGSLVQLMGGAIPSLRKCQIDGQTLYEVYHPFLKEGKTWNYEEYYRNGEPGEEEEWTRNISYVLNGTTEIDGKTYYKMYRVTEEGSEYYCALREEDRKVWMHSSNSETCLLYDFGMSLGDRYKTSVKEIFFQLSAIKPMRFQYNQLLNVLYYDIYIEGNSETPDYYFYSTPIVESVGCDAGWNFLQKFEPVLPNLIYHRETFKSCYEDGQCIFTADDFNKLPKPDLGIPYRPFIEEDKVWKVGTIPSSPDSPVQIVDYYYLDGDTIVDGKTYKQMWCQRYVSSNYPDYDYMSQQPSLSKVGAWYEENQKVYFYNEEHQIVQLKYDFSLDPIATLDFLNGEFVIGPKLTGLEGFKGVYRDIMTAQNGDYCTTWLEGVGDVNGPTRYPCDPILGDPVPEFLMSCTVGDEVIYLNDEYEDGATPKDMAKKRFDFTHTTKLQPKNPRRGEEELSLYGEYNNLQLGIHLDPLDDAYQVSITNESGKVVYEKTINAGTIVGLSIDISAYAKGRYTVTVENSNEVFTGEFETETTGIEVIYNKVETRTEIYNLQGQRLSSLQKGLNIVNGQKVYVK